MRATRLTVLLAVLAAAPAVAQTNSVYGRWDLVANAGGSVYPMWLELTTGAPPGGRLQGGWGHALPLSNVRVEKAQVTFPVPTEQPTPNPAQFTATVNGNQLSGEIVSPEGGRIVITGRRAPSLVRSRSPDWGEPVNLLANGLSSWEARGGRSGWSYIEGVLTNLPPSVDLISRAQFTDFKLHIEVNVPLQGNSGIYLRGRYEVQVQDDYAKPPCNRCMGGIYGQVQPMRNAAKPPGDWQAFDITLIGRRVTVVLNGVTVIDNQEIPGITGGALDSNEGDPGPIMLQGDHTGVKYRNIRIIPAR
ncbi:MAG TPA: DUF1080 domain-containing protein [Gemmatimonadales bacterium]